MRGLLGNVIKIGSKKKKKIHNVLVRDETGSVFLLAINLNYLGTYPTGKAVTKQGFYIDIEM